MSEQRQKLRKPKAKIHLPECWVEIEKIPVRALPRVGEQYQVADIPKLRREKEIYEGSECGILLSEEELVKDSAEWDDIEKSKFENGILHFNKDFRKIQTMIKTKTLPQIIEHYYRWKHTSDYITFIANNSTIDLDANHININNINEHFINPTLWNQFILSYSVDPIPTYNYYPPPTRFDNPVFFDVSVNAGIDLSKVKSCDETSIPSPHTFPSTTYSPIPESPEIVSESPLASSSPDFTTSPINPPPTRKQTARRTNPKRRRKPFSFGYLDYISATSKPFAPSTSPLDVVPATPSPQLDSSGLEEEDQYLFFMADDGDATSDEDYVDKSRSRKKLKEDV